MEVQVGAGLLLVIILCYTAGRLHQWARAGIDRDNAFREGYDAATHSLFYLATKVSTRMRDAAPLTHTRELPLPEPVVLPVAKQHPVRPAPRRRGPRHAA